MSLRKVRQSKELSVNELSRMIGKSESYIYQIERGIKLPSMIVAQLIAKALDSTVQELFFSEQD